MLAHELEQAGVELGTMMLEDFVRTDLRDHGEVALQGYLVIVQAVAGPRAKRGFMGLFGFSPNSPSVSLWIQRIKQIHIENDVLVIAGEAEASS